MTDKQLKVVINNMDWYANRSLTADEVTRVAQLQGWEAKKLVRLLVGYKLEEAIKFMTEKHILDQKLTIKPGKVGELKRRRAWYAKQWAARMAQKGQVKPGKVKPEEPQEPEEKAEPEPQVGEVAIVVSTPEVNTIVSKQEESKPDDWELEMLLKLGLI
jgi:hypothetical protein